MEYDTVGMNSPRFHPLPAFGPDQPVVLGALSYSAAR